MLSISSLGAESATGRRGLALANGDDGGGMAMALGTRGRGVLPVDGRPLPNARPDSLDVVSALGVVNGERVGEVPMIDVLPGDGRAGLLGERFTLELASSFAVKLASLEARDPGVALPGGGGFMTSFGRAEGVVAVLRVLGNDGVVRPLDAPGVTLPLVE